MSEELKELRTTEAARRLGIRLDYLTMLLRGGKLAGRKEDGRWLVSAESVAARLERPDARNA